MTRTAVVGALVASICALLMTVSTAQADWPELPSNLPALSTIQSAASDSGWTAGTNPVWNLTWQQKAYHLGWIPPSGFRAPDPTSLPAPLRDLPSSWDWRDVEDVGYMSSVKNQGSCGSCWAFAACSVVEALRKIKGKTASGFDDLSEQFMVSCCDDNLGCDGGYTDTTADFLKDTGTTDEACFTYQAADSTGGVPCSNRCDDWSDRLYRIANWNYVRSGGLPTDPGAVDSLKQAVYNAPQWVTMFVCADFYAYKSGVYRHVVGPPLGGHAIVLVGYDDSNNCFICKNSWGATWGENGYFRLAYSQVYNLVQFGKYCVNYALYTGIGGGGSLEYRGVLGEYDWRGGSTGLMAGVDDMVISVPLPFTASFFGLEESMLRVSTNGWAGFGPERDESWPDHYPIPHPDGPSAMLAPYWTDLDASIPGAEILTAHTFDHRFVIEYRNMLDKSTGSLETFEIVLLDPAHYPTRTGEAILQFQYQQHDAAAAQHTVGIESHSQGTGVERFCDGLGHAVLPFSTIVFEPLGHGDEHDPEPVQMESLVYDEPYVQLAWTNPTHDVESFPLLYLTSVIVERDGTPIAELNAQPGEAMTYDYREPDEDLHLYTVTPRTGERRGAAAGGYLTIPPRVHIAHHDVGEAVLSVTDRGTVGFLDATQAEGYGFRFPAGSDNVLFIGSLWAGTSPEYALNRDYNDDPFADWVMLHDLEGPVAGISDQDFCAVFDDAGHALPAGLTVTQESFAWSSPPDDGYVILRYRLENSGSEQIAGLHAGVFADWDIGSNPVANQGRVAADLALVYMWQGQGYPYVGVAVLDTIPGSAPRANLSLVHNPTYVWPEQHVLDADRWGFLSGSAAEYRVAVSWQPDDWSAIASCGPIELGPGASAQATFAVVGGMSESELFANTVAARQRFLEVSSIDLSGPTGEATRLLGNMPNPFSEETTLRFILASASEAEVAVFDVAGRRVRLLQRGPHKPGLHWIQWDGRDQEGARVPSGIYFMRVQIDGQTLARPLVKSR